MRPSFSFCLISLLSRHKSVPTTLLPSRVATMAFVLDLNFVTAHCKRKQSSHSEKK